MRAPFRLDRHPSLPAKAKRWLRAMRRQAIGEVHDDRYPDTSRHERLPALYKARARRRAKNKVAKRSRKANR